MKNIIVNIAIIIFFINIANANTDNNSKMQQGNPISTIESADNLMRRGTPGEALKEYQSAWVSSRKDLNETQQIWLLLSLANAAVRYGDYEEALNALSSLLEGYKSSGIIVGNPLFHLLIGLTY
ncbi:MAG: tetratricopeptide repeat protein [Desulfobacterales bacterium]|nr:tetratricopeptide repeat protein [Desulfobacterales bacterium]